MATGILQTDWLNENRNRRYPFFDGTSMTDTTGTLTVPNELIIDLVFPVQAMSYDPAKFYLQSLTVFTGGVIISVGYEGVSDPIAVRSITEQGHTENKAYYIEGNGSFADSVGRINIGRFTEIKNYGGTYTFAATATRFLPTVIRPTLRGVSGLRIVTADNETSDLIQGDVELVQGDNITLELLPTNPGDPKQLRISAVNNPSYDESCDCPDTTTGPCIQTISGVGPDESGNVELIGYNCLALDTNSVSNGIVLTDTCAEPCCGCEELTTLREELARLGTALATQRAFAQRAFSSVEQLRDVILASKFGSIIPC